MVLNDFSPDSGVTLEQGVMSYQLIGNRILFDRKNIYRKKENMNFDVILSCTLFL